MRISNAYYLIIDFEATCADDGSIRQEEMEIIEIGAVLQNSDTLEIESEFQTFVRPQRHPVLTPFCTKLTSIQQQDLEDAPEFPDALDQMKQWLEPYDDYLFCSWGSFDRNQLKLDCAYHQCEPFLALDHMNLKVAFSRVLSTRRRFGLSNAVTRMGLEFEGDHHRGIDDARNIARVVRAACKELEAQEYCLG